jgi:lipopolysaccharide biosynthesis protein
MAFSKAVRAPFKRSQGRNLEMVKIRDDYLVAVKNSGQFDPQWYRDAYPDVVQLGMDPLEHFLWIGARLGRDPAPGFSTRFYLREYPDVAQSGLNPFFHFVTSGIREGRLPMLPSGREEPQLAGIGPVQFRLDRFATIQAGQDWIIFVAYCPDGRLTACQRYQIRSFKGAGYRVAVIVNSDDFACCVEPGAGECDIQIVRENVGLDFGAWRHAVEVFPDFAAARSVTFTNDSVLPVGGASKLSLLRERIEASDAAVLFMTENQEVESHAQSYFFRLGKPALAAGALSILSSIPYYDDKNALIHDVEIKLHDQFREQGHDVQILFPMAGVERNPTIHHWQELLDLGLPFLKVQLITAGLVQLDDSRLAEALDDEVLGWLRDHCQHRTSRNAGARSNRNVPPVPALPIQGRFNEYGAQQAFNLPAAQNPTFALPLQGELCELSTYPRILAVIHGFYIDVADLILGQISSLGIPMRIVVTCDTSAKADAIRASLSSHSLAGEVVVAPNRGRDVAPFIIEGAQFAKDADVILHLHTKKSPHGAVYADWGRFLRDNLIGSREIVLSILRMLDENTGLGLIYSDHFPAVVGLRNWGYDFEHARELLAALGVQISADDTLEFPTSTMFWARREALDPLFEADISYEQFEEENGQIDGTFAHAIERSLLYVAQAAGFNCAKVTAQGSSSEAGAPFLRLSPADLSYAFNRPTRYLPGDSMVHSEFYRSVPEVYPVSVARSRRKTRRLTILLPTMQPSKIYGGITTALQVIDHLIDALADEISVRVLITSDTVDAASVAELSKRLKRSFARAMPDDDVEGNTIVGLAEQQNLPISLRPEEMYVATAWWTADLGYRLLDRQREMHGGTPRLAYIIQDYEPGFYNWSNKYALAEATYHRPEETAAIINSEELANYILGRYEFGQACCIPYQINSSLAALIEPSEPQPLILAYGRPSVSRNCYELICEGLRLWQSRRPAESSKFEIVFAGEEFDERALNGLLNARNAGKLSLEDYASMLNHAAVGISLMVSPHPSYPPLEMAFAGCATITNGYDGKDLSRRAANIISLDALTPQCLADALDTAVSQIRYKQRKAVGGIKRLVTNAASADFDQIATWMLGYAEAGACSQVG